MKRASLVFVLLAACGDNGEGVKLPPDNCNPLGFDHCASPWPSSAFETDDSASLTGVKLDIPMGALPTNSAGVVADPTRWNIADGFSPAAPIILAFPGGVSADGLPPNDNYDGSITADSPTVILDMTTGERVPHFAEIDMQATATPDSQALFLRPAARLIGGHRYAVAITKKVQSQAGGDLPISEGYLALVAGKKSSHPLYQRMLARFPAVTTALATAGYDVADLVVAWDFTVASDDFLHRDMIAARDRAVAALDNHPIQFTIDTDAPIDDGSVISRRITGHFDAPLFLTNNGGIGDETIITRDSDGLPTTSGFYSVPFSAIVPTCALTSPTPVPMVIYGHGLMGKSTEATGGVQQTTASELCMVFVGTDMRGMSEIDVPAVARALNEVSLSDEVFEKLEQGLVNHIALVRAMRTTFATGLFVSADDSAKSLVDPTKVFYYGLSQGGIFGVPVMAYEPTITRAVLGVGAANYSMLLERSTDWPQYRIILSGSYTDAFDDTLAINLFQMRWDKTEGSGVANSVLDGTATGVPPKQLLLQMALGDDQVANLATLWEARSMNIPIVNPTPATAWGLTTMDSPIASGSALLIMDGGVAPPPTTNVPAPETGMHDLTRKQPATRRQMAEFYSSGRIVNECDGACTCQTDACN